MTSGFLFLVPRNQSVAFIAFALNICATSVQRLGKECWSNVRLTLMPTASRGDTLFFLLYLNGLEWIEVGLELYTLTVLLFCFLTLSTGLGKWLMFFLMPCKLSFLCINQQGTFMMISQTHPSAQIFSSANVRRASSVKRITVLCLFTGSTTYLGNGPVLCMETTYNSRNYIVM